MKAAESGHKLLKKKADALKVCVLNINFFSVLAKTKKIFLFLSMGLMTKIQRYFRAQNKIYRIPEFWTTMSPR
jgi:vacuolar-type H+-ATPase subunit D/Vma8